MIIYITGSDLAAVSAWTCLAISARAIHDVDAIAWLLIEHCPSRREDTSPRQDDVSFGRVVVIWPNDRIARFIARRSPVDDPHPKVVLAHINYANLLIDGWGRIFQQ